MRRRATTGVDGTRGVGFYFFLGGCSSVGRVLTTGVVMRRRATTGVDGTRGVGFCFFLGGCSGVGRVLTTGVVMRRRATTGVDGTRGVGFCFFLWRLLRCRRGIFYTLRSSGMRFFALLLHAPGPPAADHSAQRVGVHVASLQMPPARRAVGGAPVQQAGVVHHHQHAGFQPEIAAAAG